ncbi:DUF6695 family protein [Bacteroidota bacterium]
MKVDDAFIVVLAYPDTIVRPATRELISKFWPLLGVGGQKAVQAGHAAILLISKKTDKIEYYDFGRYVTSAGMGRVRSENTDCEVHIPLKAIHNRREISNLKEILLFLEANPDKTHGDGRLIATVCGDVNYENAITYIRKLQARVEVPYGAFISRGSNCARFVTDTLIQSVTKRNLKRRLILSKSLTPSPISNVINASCGNAIYEVFQGEILPYANRSISKEHRKCFFNKVPQVINKIGTELPNTNVYVSKKGQWLSGIGSGAWFELEQSDLKYEDLFIVTRRCPKGIVSVKAKFKINSAGFDILKSYQFLHGSNCDTCIIRQNNTIFKFKRID